MTVDLATLKAGDSIVLRNGTRHVVTLIEKDTNGDYRVETSTKRSFDANEERDYYWYHVSTGELVEEDTFYAGDIVATIPKEINSTVEVPEGNKPVRDEQAMTVDLATLKAGDTIVLRDGTQHVVTLIEKDTHGDYRVETGTYRKCDSITELDYYWYHAWNGRVVGEHEPCMGDIVGIIPKGTNSTVEVPSGNETVRASCQEVATSEALRFNTGKPRYSFLPLDLLDGAASVMEYGASKYTKGNYRKGYSDVGSPLDSLIRHVAEMQRALEAEDISGEQGFLLDKESGKAHIHHVITSAMLLIHTLRLKGYKV